MSCEPGEPSHDGVKRRRTLAILDLTALILVALSAVSFPGSRGQADIGRIEYAGIDAVAGNLDIVQQGGAPMPYVMGDVGYPGLLLAMLVFVWRFLRALEARDYTRLFPIAATHAAAGMARNGRAGFLHPTHEYGVLT